MTVRSRIKRISIPTLAAMFFATNVHAACLSTITFLGGDPNHLVGFDVPLTHFVASPKGRKVAIYASRVPRLSLYDLDSGQHFLVKMSLSLQNFILHDHRPIKFLLHLKR